MTDDTWGLLGMRIWRQSGMGALFTLGNLLVLGHQIFCHSCENRNDRKKI